MKRNILFLSIFLLVFSCKEPIARKPKTHSTTNFYNEVVAQSKKLNAIENKLIEKYIKQDTLHTYQNSAKGFWFTYNTKIEENLTSPKTDDVAVIAFNITDLAGNEIYPKQERDYKVDKQDFIPALQDGIKLMKKGETLTFVIPSYNAFGVIGDENKIERNQTLKSTITLIDIK